MSDTGTFDSLHPPQNLPARPPIRRAVGELAIFGGRPTFPSEVVVGRPNAGSRRDFLERLGRVLDSGWFTHRGPLVQELEHRIAETVGVAHCVAVANATTGLELVMRAAGVSDEIIMPSMTFVATPHSVRFHGARPVFCDIDAATGCLDPREVERAITPRTTAVLGVHLWGRPCAVDRLREISDAHGLTLYFDAAHAMGCTAGGRPIGGFGLAEVFSLHATKVVNSFEGGAVVTDDAQFAAEVRALHNFGRGPDGRPQGVGTNAKLTEAAAAMGLTSLDAMPSSIEHNEARHHAYRAQLADVPGIEVLRYEPRNRNNFQYLVIEVDESVNGLRRDALLAILRAENVVAQRYFSPCCHEVEPYRSENPVVLPRAEALSAKVLALPTGRSVSLGDVVEISRLVRTAAVHGEEITRRWLSTT